MLGERLCGGRILREGLHARFTRMHIWPVTRFASNGARMHIWSVTRYTSNGRMGMRIFDRW
ncbi:hypothetical protein [Listeria monocytogenes]|uniref:hypothetical protein n=1 Tax=Listeria monocytogenes TaxID=1639 RepID=UPI003204D263